MLKRGALLIILGAVVFLQGCGYGWAGRGNPWSKDGVKSVYVRAMINNSPHAGVEIPLTGALLKEFVRGGRIRLATSEKEADATVSGTITDFHSEINSATQVPSVAQNDLTALALSDQIIASEYVASAAVIVSLVRSKDGRQLWSQSFSRRKVYPAGNRYGLQGSTSALIDASQEQLALGDMANFIASDIYDTMLEAF